MYVKLFTSLYQGTLRGRTNEILVFTNLLAHADQHGCVDMHWKAIAEETGLPEDAVRTAIANLEAPDSESRSPECNGCRIVRVDDHKAWGWQVVNYVKYRAIRNEDDRREQNRLAQKRYRDSQRKQTSAAVSRDKPRSAYTEAEADAHTEAKQSQKKEPVRGSRLPQGWQPAYDLCEWAMHERPDLDHDRELASFNDYWRALPGAKGVKLDWPATYRNWIRRANGGIQRAAVNSAPSKARQKLNNLQDFKNGLAETGNSVRVSTANLPLSGPPADRRSD